MILVRGETVLNGRLQVTHLLVLECHRHDLFSREAISLAPMPLLRHEMLSQKADSR